MTECKIDDCERPSRARGMCGPHYKKVMRRNMPEAARPIRTRCEIPGCDRRHHAGGMCPPHYKRWLIHGDPLAGGPIRSKDGTGQQMGRIDAKPMLDYIAAHHPYVPHRYIRILERAKANGYLSIESADRVAIRLLNVHPCMVFGDDWWATDMEGVA